VPACVGDVAGDGLFCLGDRFNNPGGMGQECYWVIGPRTEVGKTTLAAALLRVLNRRRCGALGFKPYSATLFAGAIERMCDPQSPTKSSLVGKDARTLADSSPLTGVADAECIVPVQYICHPHYHSAMIARIGSRTIDDRRCIKSDDHRDFLARSDVASIFDRNRSSTGDMESSPNLAFSKAPADGRDLVAKSYEALVSRSGVDVVVCEGAGQFLPLWRGAPVVDHILHVDTVAVRLFPNIRLSSDTRQLETLRSGKTIDYILRDAGGVSTVFPMVPTSQRELVAEETVETLMHAAKLG
jgi:hypothetical protein